MTTPNHCKQNELKIKKKKMQTSISNALKKWNLEKEEYLHAGKQVPQDSKNTIQR